MSHPAGNNKHIVSHLRYAVIPETNISTPGRGEVPECVLHYVILILVLPAPFCY